MRRSSLTAVTPRASRVWERLRQWYGARLAEQYGDEPPADWCEAVNTATDDVIKLALRGVREKHVAHPPTLPEFETLLRKGAAVRSTAHSVDYRLLMVEHAIRFCRLSDAQRASPWNWIVRWFDDPKPNEPGRKGAEILGVIIPQCPKDPEGYPSRRVMVADLDAKGTEAA